MNEHWIVPEERAGIELDEFLCLQLSDVHKGYLRDQVRSGAVLVDGQRARPGQHLRRFQVVSVELDEASLPRRPLAPVNLPVVLYEDEALLVVDKPPGIAVEPERWEPDNPCFSAALLELARQRAQPNGELPFRPRLVHRIDKDTSGALLVAKNIESERALREAFDQRQIQKTYLALVEGELGLEDGETLEIEQAIAPDRRRTGRMRVVNKHGKASHTSVAVEERFRGYTLVRCHPHTGRTHQIRVHLAHEGFPLIVDPLYGRSDALLLSDIKRGYRPKRGQVERPLLARLSLHARSLSFPDLARGEGYHSVSSELPKDFERARKQLEKCRPPARWRA